ncbi:MAG: DNA cytosine methyltransferase [Burkholderiales bacterium]|nr:DNA cytosine methyltransferase [Burkholderiales bacterium]
MNKTFYEFFAGGGMAHAGLGDGWHCAFANDVSPMKSAAYKANWGAASLVTQDIASVSAAQLPGHADLAWASFPCQDLSLAGNGAGLNGTRSGTFWPFIGLMETLRQQGRKPSVIALENVYGAITSNGGRDFECMIEAVHSLGYRVGAMLINAVHFVPQSRQRLFVIGVADTAGIPAQCTTQTPNAAWHPEALIRAQHKLPEHLRTQWVWWDLPQPSQPVPTLDDIMETHPQGVAWHTQEETAKLLTMMSPLNMRKIVLAQKAHCVRVGTVYRRTRQGVQRAEVRFDGIAGCLRTPGGGSSRQTIIVVDGPNIRTRLLSPREAARLMGLPEQYQLPNRYNDAYHLAGDGVVVPVVAHLATHIINVLVDHCTHAALTQKAA